MPPPAKGRPPGGLTGIRPCAPRLHRIDEGSRRIERCGPASVAGDERHLLAGTEPEPRVSEWTRFPFPDLAPPLRHSHEHQALAASGREKAIAHRHDLGPRPPVVEARTPLDLDPDFSALTAHDAMDLRCGYRVPRPDDGAGERHEVRHDECSAVILEARPEDVRILHVALSPRRGSGWSDPEVPSATAVKERGEYAWPVQLRQAAPVDGAIAPHEGDRAQVADRSVVLDRKVSAVRPHHAHPPASLQSPS